MTSMSHTVHDLATWAKARLDELDATVVAMEDRMATVSDEARLQAHLALLDARKWRETFRARVRDLRRTVDSGAGQMKSDLDYAWNEFELAFGRWVGATGEHMSELQARTKAQVAAWQRLSDQYKTKLEAGAKNAEARVDAGVRAVEDIAAKQNERLEKLQKAGVNSYAAWVEALRQSRSAFDEAVRATRAHFTAAS